MNERALVLGGGGPAGIAWEVGIAAGLATEGVDLRRADFILGTSAGSFVGAQLARGFDPVQLADLHKTVARKRAEQATPAAPPRLNNWLAYLARMPRDAPPTTDMMRELGAAAQQAKTVSEVDFVATFLGIFGPNPSWPDRFTCTAVDARNGHFKLLAAEDKVPLERAVAASCSVPSIFPPVALLDSVYIDGGVRSWTNADCAAGYKRVVVVGVVLNEAREMLLAALARERAAIEAAGGRVELITPDAATLAAIGDNAMASARGLELADAGIAQGKREAARVAALWG